MPPHIKEALAKFVKSLIIMEEGGELSDGEKEQSLQAIKLIINKHRKVEIPEGAELVWELAGGKPETFVKFLQSVPDPELQNLAADQLRLERVVAELSAQFPPEEYDEGLYGAPKQAQFPSSNIFDFKYNPRDKTLLVKFQGNKGVGEGPVYEYKGVPPFIYKLFSGGEISAKTTGKNKWGKWWKHKNPSLGATHYAIIRNAFPYKKVA